jgi:tetratricopeptide repeat protein 21B
VQRHDPHQAEEQPGAGGQAPPGHPHQEQGPGARPRGHGPLQVLAKEAEYQLQHAEYFEKAWLLLADFFISNNKYDLAEAELQKCLKYNKSMVKAEEYMGMIKEKERIYIDAANHYEKAWTMSNKRNAGVGFRLAFNYIKASRFVDAIDIGKDILKVYPDYPKVQKEIVEKSRSMIRA